MFDGRFRTGVDRAVKPIGDALSATRLSPDHLTAVGLVLALPTAVVIATGHLHVGLVLLILTAVPDLLDGALAKASGRASSRGAFFDSVADRVSDTFVLGGVAWYLQDRSGGHAFVIPFAVLGASLLVSYERAKAESLGYDAKGGLMERAERIIVLCLGLLIGSLLVPLLVAMLVLTLVTAAQRFVKVWRQASKPIGSTTQPLGHGSAELAVAARWRAWREAGAGSARPSRYGAMSFRSGSASERGERWGQRRRARRADERTGSRRRSTSRRP